jgi:hypothetical protein
MWGRTSVKVSAFAGERAPYSAPPADGGQVQCERLGDVDYVTLTIRSENVSGQGL